MSIIAIIMAAISAFLIIMLGGFVSNRSQLKKAFTYGKKTFDIELPTGAKINKEKSGNEFPTFSNCSDAESFFQLITPYVGSLSVEKREALALDIEKLKTNLKVNKEIYRYFMDEYSSYKGLTDDEAAEKWSGEN